MFKHGPATSGYYDSWKYGGITLAKRKENSIIKELTAKHFIEVADAKKHKYKVLVAPLHDGSNFIRSPDSSRVWQVMESDGNGFIRIPREIVDLGYLARLSGRQLLVLLQLYLFNKLSIYGGVDPNIIRFPTKQTINGCRDIFAFEEIDTSLHNDIYLSCEDFNITLATLLKTGLVKPVRIVSVSDNTRIHYVRDFADGMELLPEEQVIQILRPVYQVKGEVEKWNECSR